MLSGRCSRLRLARRFGFMALLSQLPLIDTFRRTSAWPGTMRWGLKRMPGTTPSSPRSRTPLNPTCVLLPRLKLMPSLSTLPFPSTTPERVFELARNVTAEAETPYDQAKALESFLRTYPYDLDVPEPPADADVADYFLFDLQKGYCDYYATSMVVMARSLGLPSRLAVGYAAGEYDENRRYFSVVEGGCPFLARGLFSPVMVGFLSSQQPRSLCSCYQPLEAQADVVEQESIDLAEQLAQLRRQSWLLYGAWRWALPLFAFIVLMLAMRSMWREWRLRRQAANPWQLAWLRLEAWGNRLDVPPAPWLTPREYAHRWRTQLTRRMISLPVPKQRLTKLTQLSEALEQRAYAPASTRPDDRDAMPLWRRLRSNLRRLRGKSASGE